MANGNRIPRADMKYITAAIVVLTLTAVWVHQVYTSNADMMLYMYVISVGFAAAVVLFGKGALQSGIKAMHDIRNGGSREGGE